MNRRKQLILIVTLLLSLSSVLGIRYVAAQCAGSWNILESPNPGLSNNQLNGIATLSANDAWAVGVYVNQATNRFENLAMHWDGTQWIITPTPNPGSSTNQLKKVAAISSNDVWAIGGHGLTYSLHWDGSVWNVVRTPNPSIQNYLDDIAAIASNDVWAVGSMATPDGSVNTLTAHWNGTSWTQVPSANVPFPDRTGFYPSYLNGLTAVSANDVWAVGQYRVGNTLFPLIEHWDGQTWTIVSSPNGPTGDGRLWAIAAASANDIWAVGEYGLSDFNSSGSALAMHWDGLQWTTAIMPQPSTFGVSPLVGITALSANNAWAVGVWENESQGENTFIAHWDGSVWSQIATPDLPGTGTGWNTLKDIAAISSSDIFAAGWKQSNFGAAYTTLVERYRDQCEPPASVEVSSLALNPSSVVGGSSSEATVTLNGPAPQGGTQVTLSSSNTSLAVTPASVGIPAGASSASFNINTTSVSVSDTAVITASLNGSAQQATISVTPAALSSVASLALRPASVTGGASSQATVTLDGPAPANGSVVTLGSSNSSVAAVPQSVTITAGASSASFSINTAAVSVSDTAVITASLNGSAQQATISVTPAALSSLVLSPASVTGGASSQATVALNGPAPANGAVITLGSGNTSVATVPQSVTITAGASSASFILNTSAVSVSSTALITAQLNGNAQQATISVTPAPAALSALALSPASVTGGASSQGSVTLNGPAPANGAVITLSSSNTAAATVPQSVTIPAGATSIGFPVTTRSVTTSTAVVISASFNGVSKSATLTVSPAAPAPAPAPATDTVTITRAEYTVSKRELRLEVVGSNVSATMKLFTTTGSLIGTLVNNGNSGKYQGQFSWPTNPQNVTVKSSLGGSATRAVAAK